LPELHEALLDPEAVGALVVELQARCAIDSVQVRAGGGVRRMALAEASALFQSGEASALQVRYAFEGDAWCDTLTRVAGEIRLVRMALSPAR
jgi:hypothetical protein